MTLAATITIGELNAPDLKNGFLESLESLAAVELNFEEAVAVLQRRLRAGIRTYVARDEGRVVGTVTLLVEDKFIHQGRRVGHIEDVAVHRDYRNQGIGAALVEHATEQARQLGCYKAILSCFDTLVPFYEQRGYHRHDVGMRIDLS